MTRNRLFTVCFSLVTVFTGGKLCAQVKTLKATNMWKGSVRDVALMKKTPKGGYIANYKTFAIVWKLWNDKQKMPKVDFKKEIVLFGTTRGSVIRLTPRLDPKGDLKVLGLATADFGPGFRYVMITVPRAGIKTVNGKKIK